MDTTLRRSASTPKWAISGTSTSRRLRSAITRNIRAGRRQYAKNRISRGADVGVGGIDIQVSPQGAKEGNPDMQPIRTSIVQAMVGHIRGKAACVGLFRRPRVRAARQASCVASILAPLRNNATTISKITNAPADELSQNVFQSRTAEAPDPVVKKSSAWPEISDPAYIPTP